MLDGIEGPQDLKRLSERELGELVEELRSEIIRVTAQTGGHLASSLGAVELIVALHRVFDSPRDKILFDVGHQAYAHKLLTGRRDRFHTLRQEGGISGFTKVSESPHDAITVGHASTSLANALGMALARDVKGEDYKIVAVIGDGALTGGMALAALNKIGELGKDILIILNDNEMSISPNVGALNRYFRSLQVQRWVQGAEATGKKVLERISPKLYGLADRAKEAAKLLVHQENPFYAWRLRYVGPVDGHDLRGLIYLLEHLKALEGPTILHIVTKKGYGYKVAEEDPVKWHGVGPFDPKAPQGSKKKGYSWSLAFGDALVELAQSDERIYAITPAMREGSGLTEFAERFPERYVDVGIAEDVAVTTGAGLALSGMRPVVAIYSTFLQRAVDQVIHDVAIENLNVVFAIDRAGLVGADGPTHHGVFDISILRAIPNLKILAPKDAAELRAMLKAAFKVGGPVAIRYPRGQTDPVQPGLWPEIEWGRWEIVKEGDEVAILAFGKTLGYALEAAGHDPRVAVVNARFIKPLDEAMLRALVARGMRILTVEDHQLCGGFGSAVLEALEAMGRPLPVKRLGLPDRFTGQGKIERLHQKAGIDAAGIRRALAELGVKPALAFGE